MTRRIALAAALLAGAAPAADAHGNLPHRRTAAFAYDENAVRNPAEVTWLATHPDVVIGAENVRAFDRLKAANPRVTILGYVPFQTVLADGMRFLEQWARKNGHDPEDLYCHYEVDTLVKLRDGTTRTFPGFGAGSAKRRQDARVPSTWWKGQFPNVCPASPVFRDAFTALVVDHVAVDAGRGKFLDGVLLDTFEGSVDRHYQLGLANVAELRRRGGRDEASARKLMIADLFATWQKVELEVSRRIGRKALIVPNAGDVDNLYQWYPDVYGRHAPFDVIAVEFFITSGFNSLRRVERLKQLYDDMTASEPRRRFIINSQTNYADNVPFAFTQFILAAHDLVNHPNAWFSYHKGSAGYYGAERGSFRASHWHPNMEFDLGAPVRRAGPDLWGTKGTDRAFVFADGGPAYKVLAREYARGLVLANFGVTGGWDAIGTSPVTLELKGTYRRLLADNTLGPPVRRIALGFGEGALLVRDGAQDPSDAQDAQRVAK